MVSIELGKVVVKSQKLDKEILRTNLQKNGFDIIEDNNERKLHAIKNTIIETLFYNKNDSKYRMSEILSNKIGLSYSTLSKLFVSHENKTIEQYTIELRIEKVKELLSYNELPLKVIAKIYIIAVSKHIPINLKVLLALRYLSLRRKATGSVEISMRSRIRMF